MIGDEHSLLIDHEIDFWKIWESNPKELERQFAPIMWIVNKDKKQTYDTHIQVSTSETATARQCVPCKLDVPYGSHEDEIMDIYGTDLPNTAPTFSWVHGGYWRSGKKSWGGPMVRNAYSWGVRTIVIDYPLAPQARLVQICDSIKKSLSASMKMFSNSMFVLGGHSAGAQLLITLFHHIPGVMSLSDDHKKNVAGVFLLSPPSDMRPIIGIPSINKALQLKPEEADDFSAVLTMDKIHQGWLENRGNVEFLLCDGEYDPPALHKGGKLYIDMLKQLGFIANFKLVLKDDHFTLVDNLVDADSTITKTLKLFILKCTESRKNSKL